MEITVEMKSYIVALSALVVFFLVDFHECRSSRNTVLSRRKRYLTFPEGASVSVAACMTAQTWVYPPGIFTESIAWGIAYELPNDTKSFKDFLGPKFAGKRRNRRELYGKMEKIMDSMGYDGRSCILRSLCEASYRFLPKEDNLLHFILKIVFRYPMERLLPSEPDEHRIYHWAAHLGKENQECSEIFKCPFSLIDVAMGDYSKYLT